MKYLIIVGTGLIGASVALALRQAGYKGKITGIDKSEAERGEALMTQGFDAVYDVAELERAGVATANVILLATPVLAILDWMERLSPMLHENQLVTDVGSTKTDIAESARVLFNQPGKASFLPGHPMAGRESGGAVMAYAELFQTAMWLFTPVAEASRLETEWRSWVAKMGARTRDLNALQHDETCAWVSHLPQMLSTALAALLEDTFADDPEGLAAVQAIGGRALKETTRLGASPYSMWRDIAMTNTEPIAMTLLALEQRLAHIRENLRTPELREEFRLANAFRVQH